MSAISSAAAPYTTDVSRPGPRDSAAERIDAKSAPPAPPEAPRSPVSSERLDIRV